MNWYNGYNPVEHNDPGSFALINGVVWHHAEWHQHVRRREQEALYLCQFDDDGQSVDLSKINRLLED